MKCIIMIFYDISQKIKQENCYKLKELKELFEN